MVDVNTKTFTIYNTIPSTSENNPVYGLRHIIRNCNAQEGYKYIKDDKNKTVSNKTSFYCKDFKDYLKPTFSQGGFYSLEEFKRENYFTIAVGDFIVFGEVDDEINHSSSAEFNALKEKYKNIGMTVGEVFAYINGLPTDHLEAISK